MTAKARAGPCAAATLLALPTVGASLIERSAPAVSTPACGLEIAGAWKSTDGEPLKLLSFTAEGWADVLSGSPDQRAEDFDILAQVRYELDDPRRPRRLNFTARRGSDLFPAGESSWELVAYDDQSFTTRTEDAESLWSRVQTHRYFLTFAYRPPESTERGGADSLVAWTSLDGHRTVVEAFGVRSARDDRQPRFGPIVPDVVEQLMAQRRDSDVVLRIEVNAAEYRRSHRMLEAWAALDSTGVLAEDDPYAQTLDFLQTVIESANRCRRTALLGREHMTRMDDEQIAAPERLRDAIRSLRKQNAAADLGNAVFPAKWAPPALEP